MVDFQSKEDGRQNFQRKQNKTKRDQWKENPQARNLTLCEMSSGSAISVSYYTRKTRNKQNTSFYAMRIRKFEEEKKTQNVERNH